ncbi:TetR/AcrR family transcriptional regulator [Novosphingobium sp. G106]|uniref:TetR/AcrR family transcriptional regulator n=1 Tax=Novosphingobium sp. G106 TaxID=2849500 RepID=UPI001C2CE1D7|nr:TetR/AcrR family transcriptional regulator [Novosphingobium sp. G106]MBV1691516.1 TetR/AcrR family transcriptional regulator [Novosphingobium sp. G106]
MDVPASQPDRRQEKKAKSRERILHEAAAAIREKGAERISVQAVMARAGMTVGGFYAHFASKDDLIAQAITLMFDERYARLLSATDETPEETLGRFIDSYLSQRHRDAADKGCPIPPLAGEIGRLAAPARAAFLDGMERLNRVLETLLTQMGRSEPAALASSVLAELAGAISLARVQPDEQKAAAMLAASRSRVRDRLELR